MKKVGTNTARTHLELELCSRLIDIALVRPTPIGDGVGRRSLDERFPAKKKTAKDRVTNYEKN